MKIIAKYVRSLHGSDRNDWQWEIMFYGMMNAVKVTLLNVGLARHPSSRKSKWKFNFVENDLKQRDMWTKSITDPKQFLERSVKPHYKFNDRHFLLITRNYKQFYVYGRTYNRIYGKAL